MTEVPKQIVPKLKIDKASIFLGQQNEKGKLINAYSPFQNFVNTDRSLTDFRTNQLNFDMEHPVDMIPQESYDGAINLIINDNKNTPRLINSRFSVQNDTDFLIPEHYGYKDSNVYDTKTFDIDTQLKPIYTRIPTLKYEGLTENAGNLPCGSYTFYFKYSDVDGNETEICQESGIVQIHVGEPNQANNFRMGLEDTNSNKSCKFTLSNIDTGFDYVHVLYVRRSSGQNQETLPTYYKILYDFPIYNGICSIDITGQEATLPVTNQEFYSDLADIQAVKTQAVLNNTLVFGNCKKIEHDWEALRQMSWRIIPRWEITEGKDRLGYISAEYKVEENQNNKKANYHNSQNIYRYTGYWPDEFYRFGVVYIFEDNSVSPVFNIQGCDFDKIPKEDYYSSFFSPEHTCYDYEPGNSENESDELANDSLNNSNIISYYFRKEYGTNSKGVVKMPSKQQIFRLSGERLTSQPLSIVFDVSQINTKQLPDGEFDGASVVDYSDEEDPVKKIFQKHHIMGLFFVRQKRIPTIIAQGMVIGLTDRWRGALPILKKGTSKYAAQSFIDVEQTIQEVGSFVNAETTAVKNNALLVPDAEMNEPVFNDLFVGNEYYLEQVGKLNLNSAMAGHVKAKTYETAYKQTESGNAPKSQVTKLMNIPDGSDLRTNGKQYYCGKSGEEVGGVKVSDIKYAWKYTKAQDLTNSTSVVRGLWGPYVGMGDNVFEYGDLVNIRPKSFENREEAIDLEFRKRFFALNPYFAISDRLNIDDISKVGKQNAFLGVRCFRGDCFINFFTHRMFRNFIDHESPTNHRVVNPACWRENYAVRNTSEIILRAHSNLTKDSEGFIVSDPANPTKLFDWQTFLVLLLTGNFLGALLLINQNTQLGGNLEKIGGLKLDSQSSNALIENPAYSPLDGSNIPEDEIELRDNARPSWIAKWYPNGMANEVCESFERHKTKTFANGHALLKKMSAQSQEVSSGGIGGALKTIFTADAGWELHGVTSINRADLNAVALGQWVTFPICSNYNYAMRDLDFSSPDEETTFSRKRGFYPYFPMDPRNPQRDSNAINNAAKITVPDKEYYIFPNVPFLKQEYFTRVWWSLQDDAKSITNEFKQVLEQSYKDCDKQYGSITKLVALTSSILVVFTHGLGLISPVTIQDDKGEKLGFGDVQIFNDSIGSFWKDSIIKTPGAVYGVDHVAKKIWKFVEGSGLELISEFKVGKFLIDNLKMSELTTAPYIGRINIKTHYNAYKRDVIFTYYNDIPLDKEGNKIQLIGNDNLAFDRDLYKRIYGDDVDTPEERRNNIDRWEEQTPWSLCYNEVTDTFTTFYDWYPIESANIDNIFFSFDREKANEIFDFQAEELTTSLTKDYHTHLEEISKTKRRVKKYIMDPSFTDEVDCYWIPNNYDNIVDKNVIRRDDDSFTIIYYTSPTYNMQDLVGLSNWTYHREVITFSEFFTNKLLQLIEESKSDGLWVAGLKVITRYGENVEITYEYKHFTDPLQVLDDWIYRHNSNCLPLWKHGQAGVYDNQGEIKPTNWYGKQHEFNFEFVVREQPFQKIFNTLKMFSNKTEPYKFEFEVVGEGYEWHLYKSVLGWIQSQDAIIEDLYKEVLTLTYGELKSKYEDFPVLFNRKDSDIFVKLPYLKVRQANIPGIHYSVNNEDGSGELNPTNSKLPHNRKEDNGENKFLDNSSSTMLVYDKQLNEYRVRTEQLGNNIAKFGRIRGNMQYLEDLWNIEIRPISFRWIYLNNGELKFSKTQETRLRDKHMKVKVRYSGEDLAVIQAISTMFD